MLKCLSCKQYFSIIFKSEYGNTLNESGCKYIPVITSKGSITIPEVIDCSLYERKDLFMLSEDEKKAEIERLKKENEKLKKKKSVLDEELETLTKENRMLKESGTRWLHD